MIQKVTMYQAVCDECGKKRNPCKDRSYAEGYIAPWEYMEGRLLCRQCIERMYDYDEEKECYIPKAIPNN